MANYTVKDLSDKLGITKQAIRYKIDKMGIVFDKDEQGTIKISDKEARKLFDSYNLDLDEQEKDETNKDIEITIAIQRQEIAYLRERQEELKYQVKQLQADLKMKDDQIIKANQQLATLADQAQRLQLKQIEAPKAGFWSRLFKA